MSVLMPTFDQRAFLDRAVASLLAQTFDDWELVIVDDGSDDGTQDVVRRRLAEPRVRCHRLERNEGLGAALNVALGLARAPLIAYLPSDDLYYADHLATLLGMLAAHPEATLAYAGVRHHYNKPAPGQIDGYSLQLVQVLHRRTADRWLERDELVTDDLDRMYWAALRLRGPFVGTGHVSCEWVDHPLQRHKVLQEPLGGINPYRARYGVGQPLRYHTTIGNPVDEVALYRRFRERPDTPPAPDGLKILLVGELAYNAERVLALEERGHRLYGLWTPQPHSYTTVGPLPFGHVEDLPRQGWWEAVRRLRPDVIYALLNWQAVPFAHHVLTENPGFPFVWHFKEGPFICLNRGTWPELLDLCTRSDGQIYCTPEQREWFATVVPGTVADHPSLVLDGDLPKRDWFTADRAPRLSERDGELHTVVPGRPIGLHPETMAELAAEGIHVHFYGNYHVWLWRDWIEKVERVGARGHLHLHGMVDPDRWVSEFSRYDAGWIHVFKSENGGDVRRADWGDLNLPARIGPLVAAGLPLLQYDNAAAVVATDALVRRHDLGLFFREMSDLRAQLRNERRMAALRDSVWRQREQFTFDAHADRLVAFFRKVIAERRPGSP